MMMTLGLLLLAAPPLSSSPLVLQILLSCSFSPSRSSHSRSTPQELLPLSPSFCSSPPLSRKILCCVFRPHELSLSLLVSSFLPTLAVVTSFSRPFLFRSPFCLVVTFSSFAVSFALFFLFRQSLPPQKLPLCGWPSPWLL